MATAGEMGRVLASSLQSEEIYQHLGQAIVRLPDPDYGSLPAPCIVPRIVGREMALPRTGPSVGEHNAQVYARFGIDAAELARLRDMKIV